APSREKRTPKQSIAAAKPRIPTARVHAAPRTPATWSVMPWGFPEELPLLLEPPEPEELSTKEEQNIARLSQVVHQVPMSTLAIVSMPSRNSCHGKSVWLLP